MIHKLPDYYAVLGVASTASTAEIAHAYRRRVRSQHPDIQSGVPPDTGTAELSAVVAAYAVLRDPARRARYDRQRQPTTTTNDPPPPSATPWRRPQSLLRVGPVRYHGPPHREHHQR